MLLNFRSITLRHLVLVMWSVLLTALTGIAGAAPLRAMKKSFGRLAYALIVVGMSDLFWVIGAKPLAVIYFGIAFTIAFLDEFEDVGLSLFTTVMVSALVGSAVFVGSAGIWLKSQSLAWLPFMNAQAQSLIEQFDSILGQPTGLTPQILVTQSPSLLVVLLVAAGFIALGLGRQFYLPETPVGRLEKKLKSFYNPSFLVWVIIFSLVGTFGKLPYELGEVISKNLFNISAVFYFFQGIAVINFHFDHFKVGTFWRMLWWFFIVLQLSLVVSVVGLVDFWADFRSRLTKKSVPMKNNSWRA